MVNSDRRHRERQPGYLVQDSAQIESGLGLAQEGPVAPIQGDSWGGFECYESGEELD